MSLDAKRLNFFERYLSLWFLICMVVGVAVGKLLPGATASLNKLEGQPRIESGAEKTPQVFNLARSSWLYVALAGLYSLLDRSACRRCSKRGGHLQ